MRRFHGLPYKARLIIAYPLLVILMTMFVCEMFIRSLRGCYYMHKSFVDVRDNQAHSWDRFMYKRRPYE